MTIVIEAPAGTKPEGSDVLFWDEVLGDDEVPPKTFLEEADEITSAVEQLRIEVTGERRDTGR